MQVFITGASGHIGSVVVAELIGAGHSVLGLARSDRAARALEAAGVEVVRGELTDLDVLATAASGADGVIHLAFDHALQNAGDLAGATVIDRAALAALGSALVDTGRPLIGTNATGAFALAGFTGTLTESDALPGGPRIDSENDVIAFADRGVRAAVVRLPPTVHGDGSYGFGSGLIGLAQATGTVGYPGTGDNRWASVHARDAARVYRLALESAPAGTRWHAVAEPGIPLREIATTIGRRLELPVASIPTDAVESTFGPLAAFVVLDNPTSSDHTREALDWTPTRDGLLADLDQDPALKAGSGASH